MVIYETDRTDFDEKWRRRELCVIMYVSLHGFTRHTETGDITEAFFAIMQLGRAVRHGLAAVYGTTAPPGILISYSAHRVLLSFPPADAQRVVTCATAIFRELEQVNLVRANSHTPSPPSLICKAGVAAGEVIVDLHAHASAAQEPVGEPVDRACQLANIARRWQVLVEQGYDRLVKDLDLSTIDGEIGMLEPRPGLDKRVKGYRELVKVSAFVWRGSELSTIHNFPVLHSELDVIEDMIAEFLQQENYVRSMSRKEFEDGNVRDAKDRIESLAKRQRRKKDSPWIGALARICMILDQSTEARQEKTIQQYFADLMGKYEMLKTSLAEFEATAQQGKDDPSVWKANTTKCIEQLSSMFTAARGLQAAVNTLLRESE